MPTGIEWCDETWNPVTGCDPISEGCDHCYAKRMAVRLAGRFGYDKDYPFSITLHHKPGECLPVKKKKAKRIFVCSMGDLFHMRVPRAWVDRVLDVVEICNQHLYLMLTKRPMFMISSFENLSPCAERDVPKNLWLGVSIELDTYSRRVSDLVKMADMTDRLFVSVEPMLGPVDLSPYLDKLGWVICGGETGPGARPINPHWAMDLYKQCTDADVPFFFKGWGATEPTSYFRSWEPRELPEDMAKIANG